MEATLQPNPLVISHVNPEIGSAAGMFVPAGGVTATIGTSAISAVPPAAATSAVMRSTASHVGEYGAAVVGSALNRVAQINNIPVAAHEWLHGSIQHRMRYLHELSAHASRTWSFDRTMRRLYWGLVVALVGLTVWCYLQFGTSFLIP
jgi:hypothetical protein